MRIAIPVALLLLPAAACGGSTPTGTGAAPAAPSATPQVVQIHESEFKLDPAQITVRAGAVTFNLSDDGKASHDLHIAPAGTTNEIGSASRMQPGGTASFTVTLQPGTYDIWCGVGQHRQAGMQGTVKVT